MLSDSNERLWHSSSWCAFSSEQDCKRMRTDSIDVNIEVDESGMFPDLPAPEPAIKAVVVDLTKDQVSV